MINKIQNLIISNFPHKYKTLNTINYVDNSGNTISKEYLIFNVYTGAIEVYSDFYMLCKDLV